MFQPVVYDNRKYQTDNGGRDRENSTQRLYWFTLSKSYIQSSVKPQSSHYATNHRLQRGDFESYKGYSPSLHTTNTSSQNHTDFTGFYSSYTESYMNNYKNLNRNRKHLESQYTRTLMISSLNHSNLAKTLVKSFSQTVCNFSNQSQSEYKIFLFHQSLYVQKKTHFINLKKLTLMTILNIQFKKLL